MLSAELSPMQRLTSSSLMPTVSSWARMQDLPNQRRIAQDRDFM